MNNPYDPRSHETPPEGNDSPVTHEHRRAYDAGLIAPPLSIERSGRAVLAIVLTAAVSFFGAFYVIGKASTDACEQRQELASTIIEIINRGEPRLREFYKDGTISKQQLDNALADNAQAVKDLRFTC